jgi:hypothetical protein
MERKHAFGCACHWCGGEDGVEPIYEDQAPPSYGNAPASFQEPGNNGLAEFVIDRIKQLTSEVRIQNEENDKMKLPAAQGGRTGKAITKLPDAQQSGGGGSYLKAADIAARGTTAITITGNVRESTGQYGAGIDVDVKIGKKQYTFTLKFASGNYPRLLARFGNNPAKWKGKVKVCRAQHLGKDYVQVVD